MSATFTPFILYQSQTPKIDMAGIGTVHRHKAVCRCIPYLEERGLQQVFFLKHMVRPSKKVRSCICNPR